MQAMILAAGFGTRLLPHTRIRPKPLFPVLNQPLLLLLVERLRRSGFDRIVVNCHHLSAQVTAALSGLPGVIVQEEEILLGTGGGLARSLAVLRDEPLLVCNGDIYHSVDFGDLYRRHCAGGSGVTMAMHDFPRFNSVTVAAGRVLAFAGTKAPGNLAFTGLQVVEPAVLAGIAPDRPSCIIAHYRAMLAGGLTVACARVDGCFWTDMGTPADYLDLHRGLLRGEIPAWPELGAVSGPHCIADQAQLAGGTRLEDWVCIGAASVGADCHLERVVVWDGVQIPAGSHLVDRIVSSDFRPSQGDRP